VWMRYVVSSFAGATPYNSILPGRAGSPNRDNEKVIDKTRWAVAFRSVRGSTFYLLRIYSDASRRILPSL